MNIKRVAGSVAFGVVAASSIYAISEAIQTSPDVHTIEEVNECTRNLGKLSLGERIKVSAGTIQVGGCEGFSNMSLAPNTNDFYKTQLSEIDQAHKNESYLKFGSGVMGVAAAASALLDPINKKRR